MKTYKTYKVLLDRVETYEFEVRASTPQEARDIANDFADDAKPIYTEWQHYSTEVIENGKS